MALMRGLLSHTHTHVHTHLYHIYEEDSAGREHHKVLIDRKVLYTLDPCT